MPKNTKVVSHKQKQNANFEPDYTHRRSAKGLTVWQAIKRPKSSDQVPEKLKSEITSEKVQKEIEILKVFEEKQSFWYVKEQIGGQNPELRRGWVRTDEEKIQYIRDRQRVVRPM